MMVLSPASKIVSASNIPAALGINGIIFGVPGVGKTVLCSQAQDSPHGRKVLFIDVEGGTRSISDRSDIDVFRPTTFGDVVDIFDFLSGSEHPYRTIVIDTLNELQRLGLRDIMENAKDPEWPQLQDWGRSSEQMIRMVRAFRNLSQERGWNVFFTSHANEQKDEVEGKILVRPNLTPKATEMVCGAVDLVGYLRKNRDGVRELLLEPTNTIVAKYRQPLTGNRLPPLIQNPSMVDILDHLRTGGVYHDESVKDPSEIIIPTDEG